MASHARLAASSADITTCWWVGEIGCGRVITLRLIQRANPLPVGYLLFFKACRSEWAVDLWRATNRCCPVGVAWKAAATARYARKCKEHKTIGIVGKPRLRRLMSVSGPSRSCNL